MPTASLKVALYGKIITPLHKFPPYEKYKQKYSLYLQIIRANIPATWESHKGINMLLIKKLRKNQGIPLRELADVLGVSISQMQRYETEETRISIDYLAKIARHLNVTLSAIWIENTEEVPTHA